MRQLIDETYKNADFVGSLVTEGRTGRPTGHDVAPWFPRCRHPWCRDMATLNKAINFPKGLR